MLGGLVMDGKLGGIYVRVGAREETGEKGMKRVVGLRVVGGFGSLLITTSNYQFAQVGGW